MAQYTIEAIKHTGWEPDDHGNVVFNVVFREDDAEHLWRMRPSNEPGVGDVVHGHIEPSKSGKATWFKKDKPAAYSGGQPATSQPATNQAAPRQSPQAQRCSLVDVANHYAECLGHASTCWEQLEREPSPEALQATAATISIMAENYGCRPTSPEPAHGPKYTEIKSYIEALEEATEAQKTSLSKLIDDRQIGELLTEGDADELKMLLADVPEPVGAAGIPF